MRKIKVIIKRPDEDYGHVTHISDTLENLQRTVGGYIETVPVSDDTLIICNEEGKLEGLEYNMTFRGDDLVGTIIVAGFKGEDITDISISLQDWKKIVSKGGRN